ncbi:MAG: hypothetical protein J5449_07370 [Oscillospiraceae bacterium]|nr:hypothetical protein [Oscillospiraceae bacterium]
MADWASRRLDELAPANARQAAAQTQRALADIAELMKPLTLDETGEPIIDPLKLTDSEWTSGWKADKISENTMWHSVADPMAEITGAGELSNPEEIASFRKEIQKFGVELMEHEGESLGYAPSLQPGKPGQLLISRGASYSAWCHEMQHMRDDMAAGWTGMRILSDVDECYRREQRAYAVEIALAKKMGRTDMVKRLEDNLEKERRRLYGVRE